MAIRRVCDMCNSEESVERFYLTRRTQAANERRNWSEGAIDLCPSCVGKARPQMSKRRRPRDA